MLSSVRLFSILRLAASQAESFLGRHRCPSVVSVASLQQREKSHQQTQLQERVQSRPISHIASSMALFQQYQLSLMQPFANQVRYYQAALKPRLICDGCYFVWRHGRKHVECSDHPRHKQMKKVARRKVWQEDYTKGHVTSGLELYRKIPRQKARTVDKFAVKHNWLEGRLGNDL